MGLATLHPLGVFTVMSQRHPHFVMEDRNQRLTAALSL